MTFSKTEHWVSTKLLPRPKQIEAIQWFLDNKDKRYFFLELPVGTGKSYVGLSIAKIVGDMMGDQRTGSYVLTPQRILQEQYEQTAREHVISLYGKSNYECSTHGTTCDVGSVLEKASESKRCGNCPYQQAAAAARNNKTNLVLNYALGLTMFSFMTQFSKRDVMIFDECHNLEKFLVEFGSPVISKRKWEKVRTAPPKTNDPRELIDWISNDYRAGLLRYINELRDIVDEITERGTKLTQADVVIIKEESNYSDHLDEITKLIRLSDDWDGFQDQYVLVKDDSSITFKPLLAIKQFHDLCEPKADKFVFMSATILDHVQFCNNLGIDPSEAAFMSVDSDFPVENRPVFYLPQMKMNYQWNDQSNAAGRKQMLATIDDILLTHADESGIIHTGNFQISDWLVKNIKTQTHRIFHHNPQVGTTVNRNRVIQEFTECRGPAILISPSITEGLDLKDDLSRFAIIAKVPYKNLQDAWIKRRMQMSSQWYQLQAITDVIQGCGRVVRSAEDWGVTYILDTSWGYLFNTNRRTIPSWWQAGLS